MSQQVSLHLPYPGASSAFSLPESNLLGVLEPAYVPGVTDPVEAVLGAIRHPVSSPPLARLVHTGQHVVVVIDDMTRPTPADQLLPPVLEEIESSGTGLRIEILIATGTHRPMTAAEIEAKVGPLVATRYPVINHSCLDESSLVNLGQSANGTPIVVNRLVAQADLVVALGNTVPHCLAGWAGGAKIIQPGVCGEETTNLTHALCMVSPLPHLGRLDNPMRQEIELIVDKVRLDFMINTVLNGKRELVYVVAGHPNLSQRQTIELASQIWLRPVPVMPDIVVVASYPADLDYWQGIKGLYAAEPIIKRGGDIILVTLCTEGITTNPHHLRAIRACKGMPSRAIRHEAQRLGIRDLAGLNVATQAARVNELAYVQVVSEGLSDADLGLLGHQRAVSVQEGLRVAFERQGPAAKVLVITHGGDVAPVLSTPAQAGS